MAARKMNGQSVTIASILRGVRVVNMKAAAAFEVVELGREVLGLHAVVAHCKVGPAGLQPDG